MTKIRHKHAGTGFCKECGEVEVVWIDNGIGPYEYWGQKCNQHDWQVVCEQCEQPVEDFDEDDDDGSDGRDRWCEDDPREDR